MRLSKAKENKAGEEAAAEEEWKCLAEEAAMEGGESGEGVSVVNVKSIPDAEAAEADEDKDGSFC